MSTVGKVFVVLNLALAALFVGAAASLIGTSQEFRSKYEAEAVAHASDNKVKDMQLGDLQGQVDELSRQNQSKADQIKQQDANNAAIESDLETERQQNSDLRESVGGIDSKLGDLEQNNRSLGNRIADLERDNQGLRVERDEALDERDSANASQNAADETARSATSRANNLSLELVRSVDRAESAEANLAALSRQTGVDINSIGGQPDLKGLVLDASYQGRFPIVIVNLGKSHKVRPGFTFDVYNGSNYKGQIEVQVVNADTSSCTVKLAGDSNIGRGDRIATNL
jgi:predicted RNase H-like nuclease (RuvC/YqgF family)